jgi:uncharacterized membrane protein YhaH (DUF805 family)
MLEMYKNTIVKNYANFKGRSRRKEYWMSGPLTILVYFVLIALGFIPVIGVVFSILGGIFLLGIMVPLFAVAVRRMHDVGKSGWYMFIPIYSLILACTEGEKGPNQYGADPKNPTEELEEIGNE